MPSNHNSVLVVDDDDQIRRLVATVLRRVGLAVSEARHGGEAITLIDQHEFSVIVVDLMMPVVSGYDVIAHIVAAKPRQKCIIVMTAAGARGTERLDMNNIFEVIHKPFDVFEVAKIVQRCAETEHSP